MFLFFSNRKPMCVYKFFKEVTTEICLTLFLGIDFTDTEEAKRVVDLTTKHWHGINCLQFYFSPLSSFSSSSFFMGGVLHKWDMCTAIPPPQLIHDTNSWNGAADVPNDNVLKVVTKQVFHHNIPRGDNCSKLSHLHFCWVTVVVLVKLLVSVAGIISVPVKFKLPGVGSESAFSSAMMAKVTQQTTVLMSLIHW